jgi:lipoprotein-releasing system ATP-binding protein
MNSLLGLKAIYKSYKDVVRPLEVLRGIDLEVKNNEFLAIQGPSGAGKSTLLHILGGLDYPTQGEVFFGGINIYKLNEKELATFRNKTVGFVFQFYHLLPEFSALENVSLPGILKSWWEKGRVTAYAKLLLERLGLGSRLHHRPKQLSGGEQQRVALARALINKPQLLLCDEPTGNLDSQNGRDILSLLRELQQEDKMTVVIVTHDQDIAEVADRVVHLRDGIIIDNKYELKS